MPEHSTQPRILVIRRDNIGDLVCTTPVFRALRTRYPQALICALVNSYNLPVLENNADIDLAFAYTKAKHRPPGKSLMGVYIDRLRLMYKLRRMRFDYVILAGPGLQARSLIFARALSPKHIVGFTDETKPRSRFIDLGIPYHPVPASIHEVEDTFRLLSVLGIKPPPPPLCVTPSAATVSVIKQRMATRAGSANATIVGLHISARKPSQRWLTQHFVELIKQVSAKQSVVFMLFWSPGSGNNPLHPGDDAKAREILDASLGLPVIPYPTQALGELIAGLSVCESVICSDGGAMHLAAGLGKPIVCFFGNSDPNRWHPWGVPYHVLQHPSKDVTQISVEETLAAFTRLMAASSGRQS